MPQQDQSFHPEAPLSLALELLECLNAQQAWEAGVVAHPAAAPTDFVVSSAAANFATSVPIVADLAVAVAFATASAPVAAAAAAFAAVAAVVAVACVAASAVVDAAVDAAAAAAAVAAAAVAAAAFAAAAFADYSAIVVFAAAYVFVFAADGQRLLLL